jgi:hypothetical protein
MLSRIKSFFDWDTGKVTFFASAGGVASSIQTADIALKWTQVGIALLTLAYLLVKFSRYVLHPNRKQKIGEE